MHLLYLNSTDAFLMNEKNDDSRIFFVLILRPFEDQVYQLTIAQRS